MEEDEFIKYVVAEVSSLGIDLQRLQDEQNIFAEEAFQFLLENAHLWLEYPNNFLLLHKYPDSCRIFTRNIGKAIVAQAYINREKCRQIFLKKQDELNSVEGYERFITEHAIVKDSLYFYNFLIWLSTIFELTMHCYKRGHDYFVCGQQCLASYSDILHFNNEGGWARFDNSVSLIANIIEQISVARTKQILFEGQISLFLKYRKALERRYRYESNDWISLTHGKIDANAVRQKVSAKFRAVSALDPIRIIPGYKVKIKSISPMRLRNTKNDVLEEKIGHFTSEMQRNREKGLLSKTDGKYRRSNVSVEKISSFQKKQNTINAEKFSGVSQKKNCEVEKNDGETSKKCCIVISDKHLKEIDFAKMKSQDYDYSIKICSPSSNRDYMAENVNEMLSENISKKNYSKIDEQVTAVCPLGCAYEDLETQIIVLDTSSEEEDNEDTEIPQLQFWFNQISEIEECVRNGLCVSQEQLKLEDVYICTEVPYSSRSSALIPIKMTPVDYQQNNLPIKHTLSNSLDGDQTSNGKKRKLSEYCNVRNQLEHSTDDLNVQHNDALTQIIPNSCKETFSIERNTNNIQLTNPSDTEYEEDILNCNVKKRKVCIAQQSDCHQMEKAENDDSKSSAIVVDSNNNSLTKKLRPVSRKRRRSKRRKK